MQESDKGDNHKWKLLRKPIYELKATNQVRLFAFVIDENNVGITHGYIKKVKTDKRFQLQIDKAIDYYKRWRDEQHRESAGNA